jgi:fluoride ion exporter CrcB/FEX
MFESQRLGEAGEARLLWLNVCASLLAGLVAVALGHWLGGLL